MIIKVRVFIYFFVFGFGILLMKIILLGKMFLEIVVVKGIGYLEKK